MHGNAPDVGVLHRLPERLHGEVPGSLAGIEGAHTQVNRICSILHCSPQRLHGAGGSQ